MTWVPKAIVFAPRFFARKVAVQIVFQRRRGDLSQVVLWLVFLQQLGEFGPGESFGDGINHFDL